MRNYRREYDQYHGSKLQIKRRASRNKARRLANGRKGDGLDVDHIDGNPMNNSKGNLRKVSKKYNRSRK